MKQIRQIVLHRLNRLFGSMIALLGFTMCGTSRIHGNGDIMVMYGVPSAEYHIDGTVRRADTKQPVDSIRVVVQLAGDEPDTLYTNAQGQYALNDRRWPSETVTIRVDDEKGVFRPDSQTEKLVFDGEKDSWFLGTTYTTVDFNLNPIEK